MHFFDVRTDLFTQPIHYIAVFPASQTPSTTLLTPPTANTRRYSYCSQSKSCILAEKAGLHGEVGWERRVYCCRNFRCSLLWNLPLFRPQRRLVAEGGRSFWENSQPGSHLSYWQCRRHREFNNTRAVHYWPLLIIYILLQWWRRLTLMKYTLLQVIVQHSKSYSSEK